MNATLLENLDAEQLVSDAAPDEMLRARAVAADATSRHLLDLATVWSGLLSATSIVSDYFEHRQRSYLLLRDSEGTSRRLTERHVSFLERIMLGQSQKEVAIDVGVSPSTVAMISGEALKSLGVKRSASRAPLQLALLAHAHRDRVHARYGRSAIVRHLGVDHRVLTTMTADVALGPTLTPAERAVVRLRIEGCTHEEIARERKTSVRTIANQLAAAFRKCGASGRTELLGRLAQSEALFLPDQQCLDAEGLDKRAG